MEGTAIFISPDPNGVPHSLLNNLMHNRVLHEHVVFLTVASTPVPWVEESRGMKLQVLGDGCFQLTVTYSFKDEADLPTELEKCRNSGLNFDRLTIPYFLSRATVVPTPGAGMALWRERLFAIMLHNVGNVAVYLRLPADRAIELARASRYEFSAIHAQEKTRRRTAIIRFLQPRVRWSGARS